jgi:hypothetical protein
MAAKFDLIDSITINNKYRVWRFKIRIIRMWRMPNFKDRDQVDLIDMVFMDEKVCIGSFSLLTSICFVLLLFYYSQFLLTESRSPNNVDEKY